MPVSDIDFIKAIDVVIPILDQVITAGLKVQITEVWLTLIESKVVRYDKMDHYMDRGSSQCGHLERNSVLLKGKLKLLQ